MKKLAILASTLLATATAMASLPPRYPSSGPNPVGTIPTVRDAQLLQSRVQSGVNFLGYGNSSSSDGLGTYGQSCPTGVGRVKTIGEVVLPVLMVEFEDIKFQETTTAEKLSRQLNEAGYSDVDYKSGKTEYASSGSVRDYFLSQSRGMFSPSFEVVGKVTLTRSQAYYFASGKDEFTGYDTHDMRTYTFIEEAIKMAQDAGVDFSSYVRNDNATNYGTSTRAVPMVSLYCAGYGEADTGSALNYYNKTTEGSDMPWPHYTALVNEEKTDFGRTYNGVKFMSYFIGNELSATLGQGADGKVYIANSFLCGIGTFVHEFGHALGLPDFYCTNGSVEKGTPSMWSVMDHGSYYNESYVPVGYLAYERILCGWQKYTVLGTNARQCQLYAYTDEEAPEDADMVYVIKNPSSLKEYYVLENRRGDDVWYPKKMGNGLLVNHVYFDYNAWERNTLNNVASTLRYTILPADGQWQGPEVSGNAYRNDLFPGVTGTYKELTDTSTPQKATCYAGTKKVMQRPLYNIARVGKVLTFDYIKNFTLEGINSAVGESNATSTETYSLDGRRLKSGAALAPGVYVQDGRKVLRSR
ncbi:MAG: M6 family metalloprotease domain-containing protein [Bacteroidaceae bacterium]|nr:M6 family metalloprotease domain-containing protein [Bacteroidaceae bacterium]